jgi:glycosyltransferase involved in cell wall biosynthesis
MDPGFLNRIAVRLAGWNADRVICVSEAVRDGLAQFGLPLRKSSVVYNFLPLRADVASGTDLFTEYKIPRNARVVGMVGNICELKGQLFFVNAIRAEASSFRDVFFLIVGDVITPAHEPYKQQVIAAIKTFGLENRIILTGFRPDIHSILDRLDLLVHPATLPEAFGLVLAEAMFHKKPVIASDIGGIPEIVVHGVTGILIPPRDAEALAQSMLHLLDHPQIMRKFGEEGYALVEKKFSRDRFLNKIQAVYEETASESRRSPGRTTGSHR